MTIYLIGMPGVGKSTLGKKLARELAYDFIDLDDEIEKDSLMFIPEIFELYGEDTFRNIETSMLKQFQNDDTVISCGAGIVTRSENKKLMNGVVIWLDVPLKEIENRLNLSSLERPLLHDKTIEELYLERKDLYKSFAHYKVNNDSIGLTIDKIKEKLI